MASNASTHTLNNIHTIARAALAFVFIYHGYFPKIYWLSPTEAAITSAHQLYPNIFSPLGGYMEIILGLAILFYRRSLIPVYGAILLLLILLIDVALVLPSLLIEAFNPVSINLVCIAMAIIVIKTQSFAQFNRSSILRKERRIN